VLNEGTHGRHLANAAKQPVFGCDARCRNLLLIARALALGYIGSCACDEIVSGCSTTDPAMSVERRVMSRRASWPRSLLRTASLSPGPAAVANTSPTSSSERRVLLNCVVEKNSCEL